MAMAAAQLKTIQNGRPCSTLDASRWPLAINAMAMTPIVFWASPVPWARETKEAEAIWPARKPCAFLFSATFLVSA